MKLSMVLAVTLVLNLAAYAQQPDASAAQPSLDDTMKFILDTANNPAFDLSGSFGHRETYGVASASKCALAWNELLIGHIGFLETDRWSYALNLSQVDPNRISVHGTDWSEGYYYGFQISITIRPGATLADKTYIVWHHSGSLNRSKQDATIATMKSATCAADDKSCKIAQTKEQQVTLYIREEEAAHRVAHALRHAALLCGATSPTPF